MVCGNFDTPLEELPVEWLGKHFGKFRNLVWKVGEVCRVESKETESLLYHRALMYLNYLPGGTIAYAILTSESGLVSNKPGTDSKVDWLKFP